MEELKTLLKTLGLVPSSGYGDTIIIWKDNEMVEVKTMNIQLPKYIN